MSECGSQLQAGQRVDGKVADSFGPLGPWLVTRGQVSDPHALKLQLWVDAQARHDSSTEQMMAGDSVALEIEGLSGQTQRVTAA